jgi:MFS family permease
MLRPRMSRMTRLFRPGPAEGTTAGRDEIALRTAFVVSSLGDWIFRFAVPMLVLEVTGSAVTTAFAYAIEFIPYIVLGLVGGVVADRVDRRRLMVAADGVSCVFAVLITLVAMMDDPPLPLLFCLAFLLSCVRPFYFPALQGFIVDAIPSERFSKVNSWTQTIDSLLGFLGPVAGVAVIAALGVTSASAVNAVSFALSALLIAQTTVRRRIVAEAERGGGIVASLAADFVEGVRWLWRLSPILWGSILMAVANIATLIIEANLVPLVLDVQDEPRIIVGLVFGAQGLGAVIGALLAPRLIGRHKTGSLLVLGMLASGVAMALPVVWPGWPLVFLAWGCEGVATSIIVVSWFTARQKIVMENLIGRVASVSRAISYATIPVGALVGGWILERQGGRALFAAAAVVQLLVLAGTVLSPLSRIDRYVRTESKTTAVAE